MLSTQVTFNEVEELRRELGVSIEEAADLIGVTVLTYKNWRRGVVPRIEREPGLNTSYDVLAYCLENHLLPVTEDTPSKAKLARIQALEHALEEVGDD